MVRSAGESDPDMLSGLRRALSFGDTPLFLLGSTTPTQSSNAEIPEPAIAEPVVPAPVNNPDDDDMFALENEEVGMNDRTMRFAELTRSFPRTMGSATTILPNRANHLTLNDVSGLQLVPNDDARLRSLEEGLASLTRIIDQRLPATPNAPVVSFAPPSQSVLESQRPAPSNSASRPVLPTVLHPDATYASKASHIMTADQFVPSFTLQEVDRCPDLFSRIKDIKPSDLPSFTGAVTDNVVSWLKDLQSLLTNKLLLPVFWVNAASMSMSGSAKEWFRTDSTVNGPFKDWDDFVWRVQDRYIDVSKLARSYKAITTIRQKPSQNVSELQADFNTHLQDINYLHPDMHPIWLRKAFMADILLQMSLPSQMVSSLTVQELWKAATAAEAVLIEAFKLDLQGHLPTRPPSNTAPQGRLRAVNVPPGRPARPAAAKDFHTPDPVARKAMIDTAQVIAKASGNPIPNQVCWRCFAPGHSYPECTGNAIHPITGANPFDVKGKVTKARNQGN